MSAEKSNAVSNLEPISDGDWDDLLVRCAEMGLRRGCEIALIQGANINARRGACEVTALLEAVKGGHQSLCLMLLSRGADPNIEDWTGSNAVRIAWMYRQREIGLIVLAHGGWVFSNEADKERVGGELKTGNLDFAKHTPAMAALKAGLIDKLQELVMSEDTPIADQELKDLIKEAKSKKDPELLAVLQSAQAHKTIRSACAHAAPRA